MQWEQIAEIDEDKYEIPSNWLYPYYYEAFNIMFRIENALRVFTYVVLKNQMQNKWTTVSINNAEDKSTGTIRSIGNQRKALDKDFGYLGYPTTCPIMYLALGELVSIIDDQWSYCAECFKAKKTVIMGKFDELITVRNALAHFRPIKFDDIQVIKQNGNHVLSLIENYLHGILQCTNIVPSNKNDAWYKELMNLGNDYCRTRLYQTIDEKFVRIELNCNSIILKKTPIGLTYISYTVVKYNSSAMLTFAERLTEYIIYQSENLAYGYIKNPEDVPDFSKRISFVLSKDCLEKHYQEIHKDLSEILSKIAEEVSLVKDDNLAKGNLIEVKNVNASKRSNEWIVSASQLDTIQQDNDPPEFWGSVHIFTQNVVSHLHKYPWMQAEISKISFGA